MIFAFVHATLGWALASLAALSLRNRTPDARCWAWRLGLLKGPLALALAIPVMVASPLPSGGEGPGVRGRSLAQEAPLPRNIAPSPMLVRLSILRLPTHRRPSSLVSGGQNVVVDRPQPVVAPPLSPSPLPVLYSLGVAAVLLARLAAARRVPRAMPRVVGVFRPRVVLPDGLSPEIAGIALAHERAHVQRRDPQWSFLADLVCAALWFAPPIWLCARAMHAEAEAACDAAALEESGATRRAYARLLLDFAGPAPANALGGPARRLRRRILMLQKSSKSLPPLAAVPLLAVGLLVTLPWQAVAAGQSGPTPLPGPDAGPLTGGARYHPALRMKLDAAAKTMLYEPGVRTRVGWSDAQERAVETSALLWNRSFRDWGNHLYSLKDMMTLGQWGAWDARERPQAFARADRAAGPYPWTEAQKRALQSLALSRFGSAVWKDDAVAGRLHLTVAQIAAITEENVAIMSLYTASNGLPRALIPAKPMPPSVRRRLDVLTQRYLDAPLAQRQLLNAEIWKLKAPYQPVYTGTSIEATRSGRDRSLMESWRMRAAADRRLTALLTDAQRNTLARLKADPSAWLEPYAYSVRGHGLTLQGIQLGVDRPALRPGKAAVGQTVFDGTRYDVWRRLHPGGKDVYGYSVRATPPGTSARLPRRHRPEEAGAGMDTPGFRLDASGMMGQGGRHFWTEDLNIDGEPASALPDAAKSTEPIKIVLGKDGTEWRVYRLADPVGEYRYEVQKIVHAKP